MPTTNFNRGSSDTHSWAIVTDWCWHSGPVVDSNATTQLLDQFQLPREQRFPIGADVTQCLLLQRSGGWGLDSAPEQPQLPGSWRHSWFRVAGQLGRIVRVRLKTSREAKITNMLFPVHYWATPVQQRFVIHAVYTDSALSSSHNDFETACL